jgi:Na+/H+-dicarboxylate symporter
MKVRSELNDNKKDSAVVKKKSSPTKKIFVGLITGCISGLVLSLFKNNYFIVNAVLEHILNPFGKIFISLIKLMIVPLVFVSITLGVATLGNIKRLGRIGIKIICFYLATTALAVTIAIIFAKSIGVGSNLQIHISDPIINKTDTAHNVSVEKTILNIIPDNPINSFVQGNMLQIIFLAILFGVGITLLEDANKNKKFVRQLLESLNEINLKIIAMIMQLAPFGVFALIAYTFANFGWNVIFSLSKFLIANYFVLSFYVLVVYTMMFKFFTGLSIKKFWKKFLPVAGIAFSTASSSASLPITIKSAIQMGVSEEIASFALSLGSTINMNGTAIAQGITIIFLANVYGVNLSTLDLVKIICMAVLSAVGTAGIPSAAIIMLPMVLEVVNIPINSIGLVLGVDRVIDSGRTLVNVLGDIICTVIVAKLDNDFDEKKFND